MRASQWITSVSIVAIGAFLWCESVLAQQTTGTPGSPSATTTIDGNYIPNPAPAFGGEINLTSRPRMRPTSC
jgi:hypothetical protein